ncbi:peptidase M56 BlaR1 [Paenibacillus donghaensis]|uniref:peptidase M56 BlaR1 n=1 Tax=Paenibacillus donghaensis TaxID=414771 RepID=UPI001883F044|nr:peptidase M56 BlaR1 [Paenibacillus donghaensis]MBE9915934.1 peptidase M56 BlaR1 [Paenibacillus donghaensis]
MKMYSKSIRILIGVVFIVFVVGGVMVFQSTHAKSTTNQSHTNSPNYPENEHGQTYGSSADATSPEMEPELISALGVDGTAGYVLKKDLDGELPKSPEEAIAIQNSRSPDGRDIPLYDVDGESVIGVFHVGGK